MKRFWMVLSCLALLPLALHADTINLGGTNLSFRSPPGYVPASEKKYGPVLAVLKKAMPENVLVREVYVEKGIDEKYGKEANQMLDDYVVVTSNSQSDGFLVGLKDFGELKDEIARAQETMQTAQARDRVNQHLGKTTDGAMKIGKVRNMGVLASTDTQISFMAVMTQSASVDGELLTFDQAFVSTTLLAESKVLSVNHYRTVRSEEDVVRFKSEAPMVVAGMGFKEGAAPGVTESRPSSESGQASSAMPSGSFNNLLLYVLVGGIIALVIFRFRKRGNPKAPAAAASPAKPERSPDFPTIENSATSVKIGENPDKKDNSPSHPGPNDFGRNK